MVTRSNGLHKSSTNSMITGVAGGMAEYFAVDATLMRVGWVVLGLASAGAAIVAYIVLAVVMPSGDATAQESEEIDAAGAADKGASADHPKQGTKHRRRNLLAFVLIAVGTVLLAGNLGLFSWWRWDVLWPVVLIAIGVLFLIGRYSGRS